MARELEQLAAERRAQGLSLRQIGERLLGERRLPPRSARWYAASLAELLRGLLDESLG